MFLTHSTEGKLILILEIQSSLVRGSIVWLRPNLTPKIILEESRLVPFKKHVNSTYFVKMTIKAKKTVIDTIMRNLHIIYSEKTFKSIPQSINEIHYVLSSPWVASQARTVSLEYSQKTKVTDAEINKILSKERASNSSLSNSELVPIEEKIFDVKLNGYSVSKWKDVEAKNVELSYAISVCSKEILKELQENTYHITKGKNIFIHSSLLLQYITLRSTIIPCRDSYTLIHIHGELTDVVIVDRGSCIFFGSYPIGINTIIRKIAESTRTDTRTADSLITLYLADKLDEVNAQKIKILMNNLAHGWTSEFTKLFKGTSLATSMPQSTYISSKSHENFFLQSFCKSEKAAHVELLEMNMINTYSLAISNLN